MELAAGEQELLRAHPSWRSILSHYIVGLLIAIAVGVIFWFASSHVSGIAAAAVVYAIVIVVGLIRRITTTYVITNERLHIRKGLVRRELHQTRLERIQDMTVNQGLFERMLRVGTVEFDTAGGSHDDDFAFAGVNNPAEMMSRVDAAVRNASKAGDGLGAAPAATQAPPPAAPAES